MAQLLSLSEIAIGQMEYSIGYTVAGSIEDSVPERGVELKAIANASLNPGITKR